MRSQNDLSVNHLTPSSSFPLGSESSLAPVNKLPQDILAYILLFLSPRQVLTNAVFISKFFNLAIDKRYWNEYVNPRIASNIHALEAPKNISSKVLFRSYPEAREADRFLGKNGNRFWNFLHLTLSAKKRITQQELSNALSLIWGGQRSLGEIVNNKHLINSSGFHTFTDSQIIALQQDKKWISLFDFDGQLTQLQKDAINFLGYSKQEVIKINEDTLIQKFIDSNQIKYAGSTLTSKYGFNIAQKIALTKFGITLEKMLSMKEFGRHTLDALEAGLPLDLVSNLKFKTPDYDQNIMEGLAEYVYAINNKILEDEYCTVELQDLLNKIKRFSLIFTGVINVQTELYIALEALVSVLDELNSHRSFAAEYLFLINNIKQYPISKKYVKSDKDELTSGSSSPANDRKSTASSSSDLSALSLTPAEIAFINGEATNSFQISGLNDYSSTSSSSSTWANHNNLKADSLSENFIPGLELTPEEIELIYGTPAQISHVTSSSSSSSKDTTVISTTHYGSLFASHSNQGEFSNEELHSLKKHLTQTIDCMNTITPVTVEISVNLQMLKLVYSECNSKEFFSLSDTAVEAKINKLRFKAHETVSLFNTSFSDEDSNPCRGMENLFAEHGEKPRKSSSMR